MYRIKVCGIRQPEHAIAAAEAGADAIGLNFYPPSKRYIDPRQARQVARMVAGRVARVGVFVNEPAEHIRQIVEAVGLDAVQLHGDEPPELLADLRGIPVIRARRVGDDGIRGVVADVDACRRAGRSPDAVLVDAPVKSGFGGAGEQFDWQAVTRHAELLGGLPLMLAGGLTPHNVAEAIAVVKPFGVDVASGVESTPGGKDSGLIAQFCAAASEAQAKVDRG